MRSSGSLSIRMMIATVPTSYRPSMSGSSSSRSFCVTSSTIRLSDSARSTARMLARRAIDSGAMMNG